MSALPGQGFSRDVILLMMVLSDKASPNIAVICPARLREYYYMDESPQSDPGANTPPDPFSLVARIKSQGPAPVHLWDPPFCGDIDLIIKRDGSWVHEGRVIR